MAGFQTMEICKDIREIGGYPKRSGERLRPCRAKFSKKYRRTVTKESCVTRLHIDRVRESKQSKIWFLEKPSVRSDGTKKASTDVGKHDQKYDASFPVGPVEGLKLSPRGLRRRLFKRPP